MIQFTMITVIQSVYIYIIIIILIFSIYFSHFGNSFQQSQQKYMFKPNPLWSQSVNLNELPSSPHQSHSISNNDSLDLHSFNDKVLRRDHPCVVQRQISNYRRKVVIAARQNRKLYETVEEASIRAQIRMTRQQEQQEQPALFASLPKQDRLRATLQKSATRIYVQPKPKPKKQKLRPMISESHFINAEPEFLSVGKMALVQGQRNKKSQSVILSNIEEKLEKDKPESAATPTKAQRYFPCSQLIREINVIKEKFNIQRILTNHQNQESAKNFHKFISIKAYQKKNGGKRNYNNSTQETQEHQTVLQIQIPLSASREQPALASSIVNTPSKAVSTIIAQSRVKQSPVKKRRSFVIPFETYYYRDLLWKINFTNSLYVEVPMEYQQRLRAYVGRGNNSCMVASLISRRPWLTLTDNPDNANFLWTQLKILPFFKKQEEQLQELPQSIDSAKGYQPSSLLTALDSEQYNTYISTHASAEEHADQRLLPRSKAFRYRKIIKSNEIKDQRMQNHLINNYVIGNKKALFHTMSTFFRMQDEDVFKYLPLTFHIQNGLQDPQYYEFLKYYHKRNRQISRAGQTGGKQFNAWIVKPGENSNRGNGIKVCLSLEEVRAILRVREGYGDGTYRTYIVQAYIERPLLYCRRKFDLRHYLLLTCINGTIKGYWYRDGYVRTTSAEYSLAYNEGSIHLTNDAVQKQLPQYGKYEKGNKLSYDQLSAYIDKHHPQHRGAFYTRIYTRMKQLGANIVRACSGAIDPRKLEGNFELFGLDFMIDSQMDVWLIEANSNPCLELSCPLLATLIPRLVENTLQLTLDARFPPPQRNATRGQQYTRQLQKENRFQLVYDERVEPLQKGSVQLLDNRLLEQQDDVFEDCGDDWDDA